MPPFRRDSSIGRLPDDLREMLDAWLRDTSITHAQAADKLNEHLATRGEASRVSRTAIGRYDQRMRRVGERLRESRQIADAWIGKLGAASEGRMGPLLNEILRTLAFEISLKLHEGNLSGESLPQLIEQLKKLSATVESLERTAFEQARRRKEIERRAVENLANEVEKRADGSGAVTPEQLREIVREAYGNE